MGKEEDRVRVTLDEVAAAAGVSPTTASLILRHQQQYLSHFKPETVQRVIETARKIGYRSNLFALSLDVKDSLFFALVLHRPLSGQLNDWLTKVNMDDFLAGAVEVAGKSGVYPIVSMTGLEADENAILPIVDLIGGGVFGTLVQTPNKVFEEVMHDRLSHHNLIAVAFPMRLANWESNAIDVDNARVAELAAELLVREQRRRWIIVYDDTGSEGLAQREAAFARLAEEGGIPLETLRLPAGTDHLATRDILADRLRQSRPDGIFAPTLMASVGALLACRQVDRVPGEDLAIIGCDCDRRSSSPTPRVTSVDVSWNEAGQLATQRLLELRRAHEYRFDNILLPPRVIAGDTCPVPEGFPGVDAPAIPPFDSEAMA